jgi:hypothetical protein
MALLTASDPNSNDERVYFTRLGTVVSYVESTPDGRGLRAIVEPGPLAFPEAFAVAAEGVRSAMIAEIATRLGVPPDTVLRQSILAVFSVADAPYQQPNPWSQFRRRPRGHRQSPLI